MKSTGYIQENGKITIPSEILKKYHIEEGDILELIEMKNGLLLKPTKKSSSQAPLIKDTRQRK
jgi:AbrB family looped-hinge helix DNA binding protein